MNQPLFTEGFGDFVSVKVNAFAPRWALQDIWHAGDDAKRSSCRRRSWSSSPPSLAARRRSRKRRTRSATRSRSTIRASSGPRAGWKSGSANRAPG